MPKRQSVSRGATGKRVHAFTRLEHAGEGELVGLDAGEHVSERGPGVGVAVAGGVAADHDGPRYHVSVRHFVEQAASFVHEARLKV